MKIANGSRHFLKFMNRPWYLDNHLIIVIKIPPQRDKRGVSHTIDQGLDGSEPIGKFEGISFAFEGTSVFSRTYKVQRSV